MQKPFVLWFFLISLLISQEAYSADKQGQFGVRGAGLISCALYEQERAAQADVYLMTASWVDGYITGINQYSSDTYDILSFETTELLTSILSKHCKKHPEDTVFAVLSTLFKKLHNDRLTELSKKTEVAIGVRKVLLYVEVVKRVQMKLSAAGFYKRKIDGSYKQSSIDAMKNFQQSIDFNPTGFPDQVTLWRLLRDPENKTE